MTQEHLPNHMRFIFKLISYIVILQVLYALQNILVSTPFVAAIVVFYALFFQRTSLSSQSLKPILDHTGLNAKSNVTHERELHNLLVQQTEEVLQTPLPNFQKVIYIKFTKKIIFIFKFD